MLISFWQFMLHMALALIVALDRHLNGRSWFLWTVIVFFTGIYGFVIYIFFNRDTLELAARRFTKKKLKENLESAIPVKRIEKDNSPFPITPFGSETEKVFVDEKLESLIREGRKKEARVYLDKMLGLGKQMGDKEFIEKYSWYEEEIARISN
ncbi:MAG: hypothetical protein ABIC40_07705 [bacterium]